MKSLFFDTKNLFIITILTTNAILPATEINFKPSDNKQPVGIRNNDDAMRSLVSVHTLVFSKANLILSYASTEEHNTWMNMITNLQTYVMKQKPSSELTKSADILFAIAFQIEESIHSIFEKLIRPALKKEKDKEEGISASSITQKIDYQNLDLNVAKLDMKTIQQRVSTIKTFNNQITIAEKPLKSCNKKERNICEILNNLALYLETTINKIGTDFDTFKQELNLRAEKNRYNTKKKNLIPQLQI
jgi:hypothetical protein